MPGLNLDRDQGLNPDIRGLDPDPDLTPDP